jgi:hypothetical protein
MCPNAGIALIILLSMIVIVMNDKVARTLSCRPAPLRTIGRLLDIACSGVHCRCSLHSWHPSRRFSHRAGSRVDANRFGFQHFLAGLIQLRSSERPLQLELLCVTSTNVNLSATETATISHQIAKHSNVLQLDPRAEHACYGQDLLGCQLLYRRLNLKSFIFQHRPCFNVLWLPRLLTH